MRTPFLGANWKMNGTRDQLQSLAQTIHQGIDNDNVDVALFPSYVYCSIINSTIKPGYCRLGAQHVSDQENGAYTGEVSASMLKDIGCDYVLIGHSERRHIYQETNAQIAAQYQRALEQHMTPILCVGETSEQKHHKQVESVLAQQLEAIIQQDTIGHLQNGVIAYEPVWAIGTGQVPTAEVINANHHYIRQYLRQYSDVVADSIRIVYGGSLKPDNAQAIFTLSEVDGGLVGGASLQSDAFLTLYGQLLSR